MSIRCWLAGFVCMLLWIPVGSQAAKTKMPPGAFITRPVSSQSELARLVQEDKVTALRYSKHFAMDPAALALYFQDHLSVSELKSTKRFTAYFIAKNGRILAHRKTFKAGTKVFLAHDGQPILDLRCGNPLSARLPKIIEKVEAEQPVELPSPVITEPEITAVIEPPPVAEVLAPPIEPVIVEVLATPPVELAKVAKAPLWLIPGLIGGLAVVSGGHDEPIPEPTGVLVLGTGLVALVFRFRSRRPTVRGR